MCGADYAHLLLPSSNAPLFPSSPLLHRLLDMGFKREVEDIISYLPDKNHRQTLLFSATVPPEVKAVMAKTMRSGYVTIDCIHDTDPASHTNQQVEQTHVIVPAATRLVTGTVDILVKLIRDTKDAGEPLKLVVFFNTAHLVAFYAALFNDGLGVKVLELHSRKSQSYRTRTADAFRAADQAILFTSDVSARGVDYPGVTDVVQVSAAGAAANAAATFVSSVRFRALPAMPNHLSRYYGRRTTIYLDLKGVLVAMVVCVINVFNTLHFLRTNSLAFRTRGSRTFTASDEPAERASKVKACWSCPI